ncbi:GerMN domain-containing protein [Pectinatus brassicae]|uniref:Spore germination protein GerM n=1 Tax=Pectinatus brassicae TaxID=862415 RepID=A0A840UMH9_9FIRM|nr:GerMN domain-containing protein [Pectinatus brassicae]MBB5335888.1 spore germination protein GerM [Pectinatus brassicae]
MKQLKIILAMIMILSLLLLTGCSSTKKTEQSPADNQGIKITDNNAANNGSDANQGKNIQKIIVYFPDENGEKLISSNKIIDLAKSDKYTAAVQSLIDGPAAGQGIAIIPKNAKLLSVKVDNNKIASVDFNKNFRSNFSGGSTGELMLIGSIVDTLTNFPEITAVRFYVEGKPLDSLSGHMDLTMPIKRMKNVL